MPTGLSVKQFMDLYKGDVVLDWDHATGSTFKVALFKVLTINFSSTTFSYGSAPFTSGNEQSGSGYTAGGMNVPGRTVTETATDSTIIAINATYMEWNPITTDALRNAVFYKSDNKVWGVWDLGTPADVTTGVIRLTFSNDRMVTHKMTP